MKKDPIGDSRCDCVAFNIAPISCEFVPPKQVNLQQRTYKVGQIVVKKADGSYTTVQSL
jgi:hypothetical protein